MASRTDEDKQMNVSDLEFGDILEFEREVGPFSYVHCGIYSGNRTVIHKGMPPDVEVMQALHGKWNNEIQFRVDHIDDVAHGSRIYRNNMLDHIIRPLKEQLLLRAMARYGEAGYNLIFNNCQHFCTAARYDLPFSRQADIFSMGFFSNVLTEDYTKTRVLVSMNDIGLNKPKDPKDSDFQTKETDHYESEYSSGNEEPPLSCYQALRRNTEVYSDTDTSIIEEEIQTPNINILPPDEIFEANMPDLKPTRPYHYAPGHWFAGFVYAGLGNLYSNSLYKDSTGGSIQMSPFPVKREYPFVPLMLAIIFSGLPVILFLYCLVRK